MVKLGGNTCFASKTLARIDAARARPRREVKNLDRDFLPGRELPRSIHFRESPGTEETGHRVAARDCRVAGERKIFHVLPQRTAGCERRQEVELGA